MYEKFNNIPKIWTGRKYFIFEIFIRHNHAQSLLIDSHLLEKIPFYVCVYLRSVVSGNEWVRPVETCQEKRSIFWFQSEIRSHGEKVVRLEGLALQTDANFSSQGCIRSSNLFYSRIRWEICIAR